MLAGRPEGGRAVAGPGHGRAEGRRDETRQNGPSAVAAGRGADTPGRRRNRCRRRGRYGTCSSCRPRRPALGRRPRKFARFTLRRRAGSRGERCASVAQPQGRRLVEVQAVMIIILLGHQHAKQRQARIRIAVRARSRRIRSGSAGSSGQAGGEGRRRSHRRKRIGCISLASMANMQNFTPSCRSTARRAFPASSRSRSRSRLPASTTRRATFYLDQDRPKQQNS